MAVGFALRPAGAGDGWGSESNLSRDKYNRLNQPLAKELVGRRICPDDWRTLE